MSFKACAILVIVVLASACGKVGTATYDSRDEGSIERMTSGMSSEEKLKFFGDLDLAMHAQGGSVGDLGDHSDVLNGYTVERIRAEAGRARAFIKNKNIEFLTKAISDLKQQGRDSIGLLESSDGFLSLPKPGYVAKQYSVERLQTMLAELSGGSAPIPQAVNAPTASSGAEQNVAEGNTGNSQPTPGTNVDTICQDLDQAVTANQLTCLDRKFAKADGELNSSYKYLMGKISTQQKASLKQAQRDWIKEKESKCADAGKEFAGGTLEPVVIADCIVDMTEKRRDYLKSLMSQVDSHD